MSKSNMSKSKAPKSLYTAVLVYIDADTLAGKSDEEDQDHDIEYDPSDAISTVVVCSDRATRDEKLIAIEARKTLLASTDDSIDAIENGHELTLEQMKTIVSQADNQTAEIRFIDGTTYSLLTADDADLEYVSCNEQACDPTSGVVNVSKQRMQQLHASKDGSTQTNTAGQGWRSRWTSAGK